MSGEDLFNSPKPEEGNLKEMRELFNLPEEETFREMRELLDSRVDVNSHDDV